MNLSKIGGWHAVNPLQTQQNRKGMPAQTAQQAQSNPERPSTAEELQNKRKDLQNKLLLLNNASDSAASDETRKALEEKLEEITAQLSASEVSATETAEKASAPARLRFDEYVQEPEVQESPGLYAVERDESGYRISFTPYAEGANRADAPSEEPEAGAGAPGDRGERCTVNTDQVDQELAALKKEKEALEQQLAQADRSGGTDAEQLRRQLSALESELKSKDNDTYRKQHATYTFG